MNFEENVEQLEKVVQELENGNLNLEDSIKKFEEGMAISKKCNEILEEAAKKITVLIKKDDGVEEEDFEQSIFTTFCVNNINRNRLSKNVKI